MSIPTNAAVNVARQQLASELGCPPEAITLISADATEWNDSALGCPKPDMMYLQVITPGYRVILEYNGQQYVLHTDAGTRAVRC